MRLADLRPERLPGKSATAFGEDMTSPYTFFANLATEAPVPARGILSQTLSDEGDIEFLLFAFAAGEQLSEHTSARPAIIHVLEGEGELTADGDVYPAQPGAWLRMKPEVKHSLVARTPMRMALYLLPKQAASKAAGDE
jgi:quercetin dioxygenase-like cupin family protein